MFVADSFSSCNLKYSVEQPSRNLHKFCIFRVTGVCAQFGPAFMTRNNSIFAIWPLVIVLQQNERILAYGCAHLGLWIPVEQQKNI